MAEVMTNGWLPSNKTPVQYAGGEEGYSRPSPFLPQAKKGVSP